MALRRLLIYMVVLLAAVICAGCLGPQASAVAQPAVAAQPAAAAQLAADPVEAPVSGVEVLRIAADPPDLRVVVRGTLPDACLRAGAPVVERRGRLFEIHLPAARVQQGCPPAALDYEQVVRLPAAALDSGSYTLLVNGALFSFDLPAAAAAAQTASAGSSAEANPVQTGAVAQPAGPSVTAEVKLPAAVQMPANEVKLPAAVELPEAVEQPAAAAPAPVVLGGSDPEGCHAAALNGEPGVAAGELFSPAETFVMTWKLRNTGSCAWDASYSLVFIDGDNMAQPGPVALPEAGPGEAVDVRLPMAAPIPAGAHQGNWAIAAPDGTVFGTGGTGMYPLSMRIVTRAIQPDALTLDLQCGADHAYQQEREVYDLINAERAKVGLQPVEWVEQIAQVAVNYSFELACYNRDFVDIHRGRDGFLYPVRLQNGGILFDTSNEMIYAGNGGPGGAVKWWLESKIHRPIMLSNRYTKIGIGYVVLPSLPYQQRVTVDFIAP